MVNVLYDEINEPRRLDLFDAGGGWEASVRVLPDGTVEVKPDRHGLAGRWSRRDGVLSFVDRSGTTVARFVSEGLDRRLRAVAWGTVRAGGQWLDHYLGEALADLPRISLCIVARNRLHHVVQTLPQNLADNGDYPNLEVVLLDYNSGDGLSDWVRQNLRREMDRGLLRFFSTPHPTHFRASHSRNLAMRLAGGDILCCVDADNYTGRGFARYVADNLVPGRVLVGFRLDADGCPAPAPDQGWGGRYALHRQALFDVGGMDEEHVGWGYDDTDLYMRLRAKGYRLESIDPRHLRCIVHDDSERRQEVLYKNIGRDKSGGDGSVWINAARSQTNIEAGRIVLNGGSIGCGEVFADGVPTPIVVREMASPRLSIAIACGGQEKAVRASLPANLRALRAHPQLEIVLLDGPAGSLEPWLKADHAHDLAAGRIVHARMIVPYGQAPCENPVRQANMAARLATGDILCLASAGERLTSDWADALTREFQQGWIARRAGPSTIALSPHLFYLAEGLDQSLAPDVAGGELLARVRRGLEGMDLRPATCTGLATRDFGGGYVDRGAGEEFIPRHRFERVSYVTVCRNEADRLRQTLPQNLAANAPYPNLEFVLLDAGDDDSLESWLRTEMADHLRTGRIAYHRASPGGLGRARAMNLAMRLATGERLCVLEPDALTGHHFAFEAAGHLRTLDVLSPFQRIEEGERLACEPRWATRLAVTRTAFYACGGFDETVTDNLARTRDFVVRAEAAGYRVGAIRARFLHALPAETRSDEIRVIVDRDVGRFGAGTVVEGRDAAPRAIAPFRHLKISLCITCMDRLHHLSQTLPCNLEDNRHYPDLEVVLLDYNSSDGLEAWARTHLADHIQAGRLSYFKTEQPDYFHRSHARNLAIRLASGEIVCTVDADNFTGRDFAHYVNERFQRYDDIYLRADFDGSHAGKTDAFGRIGMRRRDFLRIEGYDEYLADYGFEDFDLCNRLEKAGLRPAVIEDDRFLHYIVHGNRDRMSRGPLLGQASLLLRGLQAGNQWESLLYLLRDGKFVWQGPPVEGVGTRGQWGQIEGGLLLTCVEGRRATLRQEGGFDAYRFEHAPATLRFSPSKDIDFFSDASKDLAMATNERRYRDNVGRSDSRVNGGRFGVAAVSVNFGRRIVTLDEVESHGNILP